MARTNSQSQALAADLFFMMAGVKSALDVYLATFLMFLAGQLSLV